MQDFDQETADYLVACDQESIAVAYEHMTYARERAGDPTDPFHVHFYKEALSYQRILNNYYRQIIEVRGY